MRESRQAKTELAGLPADLRAALLHRAQRQGHR